MKTYSSLLGTGLAALLAAGPGLGAAFVRNPSFESNYNETWPHYGAVDEWAGASGVNDLDLDPTGPFHNQGTPVPDRGRVGFKQGGGDVTQDISGLQPGATYWLQVFYDGRRGGGASEELALKFNDEELGRNANLKPSGGAYYFLNGKFTAAADTGTIRFTHLVVGDRTVLLDGVSVVARATNDIVLMNPSFEASGTLPGVGAVTPLAGWSQTGVVGVDDGTGGQANNGVVPDQDLVAFINGAGSLSQPLDGLIVGNEYELRLAANARSGSTPTLQIKVGDAVVKEQALAPGAYQNLTVKFTATAVDTTLTLAQSKAGADTLLLDNVRLLGVVKKPLPPMTFSPLVSEVSPGQEVTHTLTIPAEAVAAGGVDIRLGSSSPAVGRLVGAAADGTLTLRFDPGATTRTFTVGTAARGSTAVNVLDSAKIPFSATPAVNVVGSFVKNASFESGPAPGFPGYGDILGWQRQGNSGVNRTGGPNDPAGPFGDNGLVPDREQVGFLQGSGSLSQTVSGLTAGRRHWLQFRYNARNCCGERSQKLTVRFGGKVLAEYAELKPAADAGEVAYHTASLAFTPAASTGLLEFVHEVASGDASAVIDAVNIVARAADEIVLQNPSFEASGSPVGVGYVQPYAIAGWEGNGGRGINVDGEGPFTDNGASPDQDRAVFIQGVGGFLSQNVTGLTVGQRYTLVFARNARNCCGGQPAIKVSLGDKTLLEEDVAPVGGRNPYLAKYLPFTAAATEAVLKFELTGPAGSDVTLLLDDVHIVPGERTPPTITTQPADQTVDAGTTVALSVTATGNNLTYQWRRNGVPLTNGARVSGATSAKLFVLQSLPVADAGDYTVLVSDGLGVVGSDPAVVEVQAVAGAPELRAVRVAAGVQLRWPAGAAGFRLQQAGLLGGQWTNVTDAVVVEGADNVVTVATGGNSGFYRLTN